MSETDDMNKTTSQLSKEETKKPVENKLQIGSVLLGSIGRNIATSLLIISLIVSFILLATNTFGLLVTMEDASKSGILYLINVLTTALAAVFAALLVIQISYYRRELKKKELVRQLQMSEREFFMRLNEDVRSLLQGSQKQ